MASILLPFFFAPLSAILNGQSLVLFGDIFIITLVFITLVNKKLHRGSILIIVLAILALAGLFGVFRYGFNINIIGLFFKSRGLLVYLLTIFFYIHTFLKLKNNELIKVDSFIENVIKLNIIAILVEGIAINYFGLQPYLVQIFSSAPDFRINPPTPEEYNTLYNMQLERFL